jgi:hypothetical protein
MLKIVSAAILALTFTVSFAGSSEALPHCKKGKACGESCIAMDKECHLPAVKVCKKGKACGDSCIAMTKTCTK